MENIKSFIDPREFQFMELELFQPLWSKKFFELKFDDELIATIHWPTWFRTIAHCVNYYGEWSIRRRGIFHSKIITRRSGSKTDLCELKMDNYQKGKLKLGSRVLKWKSIDIWKSEMGWVENERDIMLFKLSYSLTKKRFAKMRIIKTDYSDEELSILMLVGLYMINNAAQHNGF